jgi:hypothetical protein
MNAIILSCVSDAVFRFARQEDWWPFSSRGCWLGSAGECIDSDVMAHKYVCVHSVPDSVRVFGFDELAELMPVSDQCVVFSISRVNEVFSDER